MSPDDALAPSEGPISCACRGKSRALVRRAPILHKRNSSLAHSDGETRTRVNRLLCTFQRPEHPVTHSARCRGPAMSLCSGASLASQACGVGRKNHGFLTKIFFMFTVTGICEGCGHSHADCVAVAMRSSVGAPSMLLHVLALSLVGRVHAMAISTPGNRACAFSQSTSMPRPSLRLLV